MVYGIYGQKAQGSSTISQTQPSIINNYYCIKPQEPDSYKGKTLKRVLTFAGIASALLFHKNIANCIQKYAPGFYEWCGNHIGKYARNIITRNPENFLVKNAVLSKTKLAQWGDATIKFFKSAV